MLDASVSSLLCTIIDVHSTIRGVDWECQLPSGHWLGPDPDGRDLYARSACDLSA